jgi:hypothetical protein
MIYKIAFIIFAIIVLLFYIALKNDYKDIPNTEPYKSILNKNLFSIEEAILIKNNTTDFTKEYPYELHDPSRIDTSAVEHEVLPIGTTFQFHRAVKAHRAVSGSTYVYLLGDVINKNGGDKKKVIYSWGSLKTMCIEEPCNYWEHLKAPWQVAKDTTKYFH